MRVLYFDPHCLLYSIQYLNKHDDVRTAFESQKLRHTSEFMRNVEPDRLGAKKLAQAAEEAGLLLYPTGDTYSRDLLIEHEVFLEYQLAPYVDLTWKLKLDDRDPVRRMFAHANALDAEWFVCGELASDERFLSFPKRNLLSKFGEGVNEELISQVLALKSLSITS